MTTPIRTPQTINETVLSRTATRGATPGSGSTRASTRSKETLALTASPSQTQSQLPPTVGSNISGQQVIVNTTTGDIQLTDVNVVVGTTVYDANNVFITATSQQTYNQTINNITNSPAGNTNGEIQFYKSGNFAADSGFVYNPVTSVLSLPVGLNVGNANVTSNLTVGGITSLGPVSNIKITGGTANYVLGTDGAGNLRWQTPSVGVGTVTSVGVVSSTLNVANTPITGAGNIRIDLPGNITANYFIGDGSRLSNITAANLTGPGKISDVISFTANTTIPFSNSSNQYTRFVGGFAVANCGISLPNAQTLSTGSTFTFINESASFPAIRDFSSTQVYYINEGQTVTAILAANNTSSGSWRFSVVGSANTTGFGSLVSNVSPNIVSPSLTGAVNMSGASTVVFGTPGTLRIAGGSNGQVLSTNGNSGISWRTVGTVSSVGVTSNSLVVASSPVTSSGNINVELPANITANFAGNGGGLTNLNGANVTGVVSNALNSINSLSAASANSVNLSNVVGIGNIASINRDGNASNVLYGNGVFAGMPSYTNLANGSSNVSIPIASGNVTVSVGGTSNVLVVTNSGARVTGTLTANSITSTVSSGTAPLVVSSNTPVANLTSEFSLNANNVSVTAAPSSTLFLTLSPAATGLNSIRSSTDLTYAVGSGTLSTPSISGNLTGGIANVNALSVNQTVNFTNASNVALGPLGNINITGGSAGQVISTDGNGDLSWTTVSTSGLSNGTSNINILNDGNITVSSNGQANIITVSSDGTNATTTIIDDLSVSGNLVVSGNTSYINVTNLNVQDPIIQLGGGANGQPLTNNDGKDRGTLLHYYTTQPVNAFMGWDNSMGEFIFASNVILANNTVFVNSYGNIAGNVVKATSVSLDNGNVVIGTSSQITNTTSPVSFYIPVEVGNAVDMIIKAADNTGKMTVIKAMALITGSNSVDYNMYSIIEAGGGAGTIQMDISASNLVIDVSSASIASTKWTIEYTEL